MRKVIYKAVGVACAALTASSVLFASGAHAQAGNIRLGEHQNLNGANWTYVVSNTNIKSGGGDKASSVRNDSDQAWVLYEHDTFRGRNYCIRPNEYVRDLHQSQWGFGDKISSVRRLGTASCAGYPVFFG